MNRNTKLTGLLVCATIAGAAAIVIGTLVRVEKKTARGGHAMPTLQVKYEDTTYTLHPQPTIRALPLHDTYVGYVDIDGEQAMIVSWFDGTARHTEVRLPAGTIRLESDQCKLIIPK